jgi:hypothetical protein
MWNRVVGEMKNSSQLWARVVMVGVTSWVGGVTMLVFKALAFDEKFIIKKNKNFKRTNHRVKSEITFFEIFRTSFHYALVITNSTITIMIISIYDHNNFPWIFAKYCAHCQLMSHDYISQSLTKYKSCESNYKLITKWQSSFFFPQEHVPKVLDTLITTSFQRSCNSSSIENTSLLKSKKQGP